MKKNRLVKKCHEAAEPGYPTRETRPACTDPSRRRFLRNLAAGAGASVLLPVSVHAQDSMEIADGLPVDFSRLERHPDVREAVLGETLAAVADQRPVDRDQDPPDISDLLAQIALSSDGTALDDSVLLGDATVGDQQGEADDTVTSDPSTGLVAQVEWVTENRALWIDPGYLLLLQWSRPADDVAVIDALNGSTGQLETFLRGRVTNVDDIHNLDRLHVVEHELLTLLEPLVTPATLEKLHIDHDCTQVCSSLNPSRAYPETIEVLGDIAAPGWE